MIDILKSKGIEFTEFKNGIVINGDCIEILDYINNFDHVITDPPYLTTDLNFDKKGFCDSVFEKIYNKLKNGYLVSYGSLEIHSKILQYFQLRYSGVWLKTTPVMRTHSAKKPASKQEIYGVYCRKDTKISDLIFNKIKEYGFKPYKTIHRNTGYKRDGKDSISRVSSSGFTKDGYISENDGFRYYTDIIEAPNKQAMKHSERTEHPTQKNVKCFSKLIEQLTNSNDIILDSFFGSGTLGEAVIYVNIKEKSNRRFIGIELDKEYYKLACERIRKIETGYLF